MEKATKRSPFPVWPGSICSPAISIRNLLASTRCKLLSVKVKCEREKSWKRQTVAMWRGRGVGRDRQAPQRPSLPHLVLPCSECCSPADRSPRLPDHFQMCEKIPPSLCCKFLEHAYVEIQKWKTNTLAIPSNTSRVWEIIFSNNLKGLWFIKT